MPVLRAYGFTLVEVLLAMSITAFIALLAYSGLTTAMTAAQRHEQQVQALAAIQLPLTVFERDIRQAVPRPVRDEYNEVIAAMSGGELNDYVLVLTRSGWDNPQLLLRSELQRVRYQLEGRQLWRESWSLLDRVDEEAGKRRTLLLDNVNALRLEFLDPNSAGASVSPLGGEWVEEWNKPNPDLLPLAVSITLELDGFGEVKRVYSVPRR